MSGDRKFTRQAYERAVLSYEAARAVRILRADEISEAQRAHDAACREERAALVLLTEHLTKGIVAVPRYLVPPEPEPEPERDSDSWDQARF
jgi:hypothetical protein